MQTRPNHAFILAAGFGKRMLPLTQTTPKPMVTINETPLLGHILNHLKNANIDKVAINTHHLPDSISAYTDTRQDLSITLSPEDKILETGGGLMHAAPLLPQNDPFIIINGDSYWVDHPNHPTAIQTLINHWDPKKMDILMLLQPVKTMHITQGVGDYDIDKNGKAARSLDQSGTHMFTSLRINHPRIMQNAPDAPFSYLHFMDEAQSKGRLYGVTYHGNWHHISTPQDLKSIQEHLKNG